VKPLVNIKNVTWLGILKGKCNKIRQQDDLKIQITISLCSLKKKRQIKIRRKIDDVSAGSQKYGQSNHEQATRLISTGKKRILNGRDYYT
jgi:hypothetical protein